MAKLPNLTGKELVAVLEKIGFQVVRQKGSHVRMKHRDNRIVSIYKAFGGIGLHIDRSAI